MKNLDVDSLKRLFSNWSLEYIKDNSISLRSKLEGNQSEIPDIIAYLHANVKGQKWSFEINGLHIKAILFAKAKYSRMYTSGCFDIFHYGHLNILKKSKELCDYLIVGVSTDELIEQEKGKKAVIPFKERFKVVEAIGFVDEVIAQHDKNKQHIVDTYKIDAISVGDDWRGRYPKVSCEMEYFTYTANVSSTILKNTLSIVS